MQSRQWRRYSADSIAYITLLMRFYNLKSNFVYRYSIKKRGSIWQIIRTEDMQTGWIEVREVESSMLMNWVNESLLKKLRISP